MAEVVVANDDLVVLGGPASINLALDVGATGIRGSYIFTDIGKPTSDQISFSIPPIIGDLFININPSDNEYLYLYQYKLVNGVLSWARVLRLVPNTVLFNPYFKFIDGEAYTPVVYNNTLIFVRGIVFSLSEGGLENEQIETLDARDLNIQFRVSGKAPVMGNLVIEDINTTFSGVTYIIANTGQVVEDQVVALDKRYMLAQFTIAEFNGTAGVEYVDGYRKVDFFATVGGRSEQIVDIDEVQLYSNDPADAIEVGGNFYPFPGGITIPGHSFVFGDKVVYLSNNNPGLGESMLPPSPGLIDGTEYFVAHVVDDTIILSTGTSPGTIVVMGSDEMIGVHSLINLGGVRINV